MNKRYFVTTDVHGFYTPFYKALTAKGFDIDNPNHYIIICGDLFDRGDEAVRLFEFVKSLGDRFIYH